jgi:beta-N-acetylhexosaminidase
VARQAWLPPPASAFRGQARSILARLSLEEKCGQLLLIGVQGQGSPSAEARALVRELGPGGILLFGFNVGDSVSDVGLLSGGLQDAAAASGAGLPLIVAIDHEGGAVFRFKTGVTRLPSAAKVGERGPEYARLLGERAGLELSALGINLALAPVVELTTSPNGSFLGERSYGSDPALVDSVAGAFIEGLGVSGVAAAAKHFPGNADVDPHRGLPVLEVDRARLDRDYVERFRKAIDHGAAVVLLSHVLVPSVDPERPATISPLLDKSLLKDRLRFDGVALTDDLFMKAISADMPPERSAVLAVKGGADLLMLSAGRSGHRVRDALMAAVRSGELPESRLDDAVLRVIELKLRFSMDSAFDREARAKRLASLPAIVAQSASVLDAQPVVPASARKGKGK